MGDVRTADTLADLPVFLHTDIEIPYAQYTLPNGLRLIVHEDHKAPIVAVNIWYHVGAKNERKGKSGLAHLFEHLMFNGSEHFNDDYFQALLGIGATDLNGTTNHDRTNYFQNVPTAALDQVLWLESDRMGHLLGALDQEKLDEQRGVVQNEKRQRENVPYGREDEILTTELFPVGHPYSWTVIGSMEDLDGTTVEDCHAWFRSFYGAANAVVVIAGDVEPEDVYERVQKYFGDIPAGPPIARPQVNIPVRDQDTRSVYQDRVPEARVVMAWNTPQLGTREDALLGLAAAVLTQGKNSRMYKSLVYEQRIASTVTAAQWSRELCGNFVIAANAKPGESIEKVEESVETILNDLLENGPDEHELKRIRARYFAGVLKGLERVGGFGGKSDILASSAVFGNSPDAYKRYNRFIADATVGEIREVCRKWLGSGRFTLTCHPMPDYQVTDKPADRTKLPDLTAIRAGLFPELQRKVLSNGLEIVVARRTGIPTLVVEAIVRAGYADDGYIPGLASLAMSMLDEGTGDMDALDISERLQFLGASLHPGAGLDHSSVRMSTLKPSLHQSVDLFAQVLQNPLFPENELERIKREQHVTIQREKVTPMAMAMRVVPRLLFGPGHRYAQPLTGTGYEETVSACTRKEVTDFHRNWFGPNNVSLVVAGDISLQEAEDLIAQRMGNWENARVPVHSAGALVTKQGGALYFLHRPDSMQSIVIGAYLVDPYDAHTDIAEEMLNDVLGGQFISRINMNLREDKHWTYGARSMILHTQSERPLLIYASVQMDKTCETVDEIRNEMMRLISENPVSEAEFEKNRKNAILALPGQWETISSVAASVGSMIKLGLPDDYFRTYAGRLNSVTLEEVHAAARRIINPELLNWFVVGDRASVLQPLKDAGFAFIVEVDSRGNPVSTS